ncbi:MAG: hypothetical protein ABL967_08905 [Bryobacteraceae bacterium]
MHREIQDQIEKILSDSGKTPRFVAEHLHDCTECREEIALMREHADLLHTIRPPAGQTYEPRPGFYARVMERIEAEGPISIWNIFIESAFGRRIAYASATLALVLGIYLVTSEMNEQPVIANQTLEQTLAPAGEVALQGNATDVLTAVPASSVQGGVQNGAMASRDDLAAQMLLQERMMLQQQMMMQQMINQMDNAASQDQVLVNLATYREQ